jgi:two-component system, NarL family, sensor histidine kinase UhpB
MGWDFGELKEFGQRAGPDVRFHTNRDHLDLNRDASTAVFRVFQETLTNIARHAQASAIEVDLEAQADSLVLRVSDNGRGIGVGELSGTKSFGLVSMRARLTALGRARHFRHTGPGHDGGGAHPA